MLTTFLDAGQLNQRLVLEQPVETGDASGGVIVTWQEVTSLWASLEPAGAALRNLAQQSTETVTHRISIRHRTDVASSWRFRKGTRTFKIITVHDPDETGRYLICRTEEEGR